MTPCCRAFRPDFAHFFTFDDLATLSSMSMHSTRAKLSVFFTFVPNSEIWGLGYAIRNGGKVRVEESGSVGCRLSCRIGGLPGLAVRLSHLLG